jgi:hypothetical protein
MKKLGTFLLILVGAAFVTAHPHFNKKVTAQLPGGVEASISYQTVPANEEHTRIAEVGSFLTPRAPRLALSGELKVGSVTIPAGESIIGVVKNGPEDWTLALYPGQLGRGQELDSSKLIKLDSLFSKTADPTGHLTIDITPGHGRHEGKAVLTISFGTLALQGALS